MKSLMPWVCVVAAYGVQLVYANGGIDAYRKGDYIKAAQNFTNESDSDPVVDYYKGRMRLYGYGLLKNNTLALQHLRKAADKGNLAAQNLMARYELLHENNPEKALYWFKKAADSNDIQAQMYCAAAYLFGYGVKENQNMARKYYIAAAKNNNPIAQYTLAEYFLDSRNAQNRKLGLIWLNKAVELGNPQAIMKQGELYAEGKDLTKDTNMARTLLEKAVKQGSVPAMYQMGALEQQLEAYEKAKDWYKKAADKEYSPAQVALAKLYLKEGLPFSNVNDGFLWMLKAAQNNSKDAQLELAKMYKEGIGVAKDENLAKEWQERSTKPAKSNKEARVEAAQWLSNGKSENFADSGYRLEGILSPWKNNNALKENDYNQPPQMVEVKRTSIYKPQFKLMDPNDVAINEYYNAIANTLNNLQNDQLTLPRYSTEKLEALLPNGPQVPDSHLKSSKKDKKDFMPKMNPDDTVDELGILAVDINNKSEQNSLFKTMENRAILGNPNAQFKLAQMYEHGIGIEPNIEKAIEFYQLAANQKDLRAEYNLGLIYLDGDKVAKNHQLAEENFRDAAFKGNPAAQYALARLKEQGLKDEQGQVVIEQNHDESIAMYYLAASNDYGPAQYRLAEILVREKPADMSVAAIEERNQLIKNLYEGAVAGGVSAASLPLAFFNAMDSNKEKQKEAFAVAKKEADNGNSHAALLVGLMMDRGLGTDQNPSEAIYWYQKTTTNPVGAFILGSYLTEGKKISQDSSTGKKLLQQSADAGFSYGDLNLAVVKHQDGEPFVPELDAARALGNSTAGLLMADYYLSLGDDPQKMNQARSIYEDFAKRGDKDAQLKLAFMYEQGLGGGVDLVSAREWYEKAAEQNQPQAKYLLARLHLQGLLDSKPDYAKAKYLMKNATGYYSPAAVALGYIYDTVDDNYQQALTAYELAASQNNPVGQFNLGLLYEMGKGVPVDYKKAGALYTQAAEQGHVQSMVQLADMYFNGSAGYRDEDKALEWYKKAAQSGDREALYQLGLMSETGVAMALDSAAAVRYYTQAADKGNSKAMLALARMYQYGQGVEKDQKKSFDIYEKLAEQNNAYAQFQLATFYYDDINGKTQPKKGKELLVKAQENGYKPASDALQWLEAQSQERLSYIEPARVNQFQGLASQPVELMYWDAMNEWNRGDETLSRMILDKIMLQFPHYTPAKRAYEQLHIQITPKVFGPSATT